MNLTHRFHYHVSRSLGPPTRQALPVFPQSSTSPRGKLVYFRGFLLALLHTERSLVILDLASGNVVGEVVGAGGKTCQEVLYDVSIRVSRLSDVSDIGQTRFRCLLASMVSS